METLTQYQRDTLAAWYQISRTRDDGELIDRRPTLAAFERLGIVGPAHRTMWGWAAEVTGYGEKLAAECAG
jgi:hypothetical protein